MPGRYIFISHMHAQIVRKATIWMHVNDQIKGQKDLRKGTTQHFGSYPVRFGSNCFIDSSIRSIIDIIIVLCPLVDNLNIDTVDHPSLAPGEARGKQRSGPAKEVWSERVSGMCPATINVPNPTQTPSSAAWVTVSVGADEAQSLFSAADVTNLR